MQARCLSKVLTTESQKIEICALAVKVFFKNELPYMESTNSVNILTQSKAKKQVIMYFINVS